MFKLFADLREAVRSSLVSRIRYEPRELTPEHVADTARRFRLSALIDPCVWVVYSNCIRGEYKVVLKR